MKLMQRIKIFISSVQNEFSEERKMLYEYFLADPLLGKFFEPFLLLLKSDAHILKVQKRLNQSNPTKCLKVMFLKW